MPFFKKKSDKQKPKSNTKFYQNASQKDQKASVNTVVPPNKPDPQNGDIGIPSNVFRGSDSKNDSKVPILKLHRTLSANDSYSDIGDLGHPSLSGASSQSSSRLSTESLTELINDKDALPHFIQYMDSRHAIHLIKFWLDAESFQAATWSRIRTHSMTTVSRSCVNSHSKQDSNNANLNGSLKDVASASSQNLENNATEVTGDSSHSVSVNEGVSSNSTKSRVQNVQNIGNTNNAINVEHNTTEELFKSNSSSSNSLLSTDLSSSMSLHASSSSKLSSDCNKNTVVAKRDRSHQKIDNGASENRLSGDVSKSVSSERHSRTTWYVDTELEDEFAQKLRKSIERDAVSIYSKYIALDCQHPIGISDDLRNCTIHKICKEDGQVDPRCFVICQEFVFDIMKNDYFPGFLGSAYHRKYQIDVLTSGNVCLADIMYNDTAMFYFMEFMEQEGAMDLIQFWLAVDIFQQHLIDMQGSYDGMEAQTDAMVIYDKYFSLQASSPLGFEDSARFEVESNICQEGGPLPDCFLTPKKIVLSTIDQVYFQQFIQSDLYYKYLSEMIITVQNAQDTLRPGKKRAGSEDSDSRSLGSQSTGSENVPVSAKNTLLASDSASNPQVRKVMDKLEDLCINSLDMNPETPLWTRDQAGKMSFGHINEFGQFLSEVDPGPDMDKKKGSRFFKKKKEKHRAQEDMAWQIAQMVVKDVTNMTKKNCALMSGQNNVPQS